MADAWDDDWIQKADVSDLTFREIHRESHANSQQSKPATSKAPPPTAKLSKAERRAKQLEFNKEIWQAA